MTFVEVARPTTAWPEDFTHLGKLPPGAVAYSTLNVYTPTTLAAIPLGPRPGLGTDASAVTSWWLYRLGHGLVAQGGAIAGGPSAAWTPPAEAFELGTYRLALCRDADPPAYDNYMGGNYFAVIPDNDDMPPLPPTTAYDTGLACSSLTLPQRLDWVTATDVAGRAGGYNVVLERIQDHYLPYDTDRPKPVVGNFSAGAFTGPELAQVTLAASTFPEVTHWANVNEPDNFGVTGTTYAAQQEAFYDAVKAGNPSAVVMGPELLHVGGRAGTWLRDFLDAGGGDFVEAWSFHTYPGHQGQYRTARRTLTFLFSVLGEYEGELAKPRFLTEACDYYSADNGGGTGCAQAQKIMVDRLTCEQFGIPKEHWYLFYWEEIGYDAHPAWLTSRGGGKMPAYGALVVHSQELLGCDPVPEVAVLDFGAQRSNYLLGSVHRRTDGTGTVAFMSDGCRTDVVWDVTGAASLTWVDHEGNTTTKTVTGGTVTIACDVMPRYIRLPADATCLPQARNFGTQRTITQATITGGFAGHRWPEVLAGTDNNALYWDRPNERSAASMPVGLQFPTAEDPVDLIVEFDEAPVDLLLFEGAQAWRYLTTIVTADVHARVQGVWTKVGEIDNDVTVLRVASTKDEGLNSWWEILDYREHTWEKELDRTLCDALRLRVYTTTAGQAPTVADLEPAGQLDEADVQVFSVGGTEGGVTVAHMAVFDTLDGAGVPGAARYVVLPGA